MTHHETYQPLCGAEAREIIDSFRGDFCDNTTVTDIADEFPYYSHVLGLRGVSLVNLADNTSGAFKWRGALVGAVKMKEQGIDSMVAPSAGNHARGAVLAAKLLDMRLTVAVPTTAPPAKRQKLRELWSSYLLTIHAEGDTFNDSLAWAEGHTAPMLHPYDNPYVIAGQGTAVDDVLAYHSEVKHLVAPVGGGGLASGIVRRLGELGRTDITVHVAQASGSNSLGNSLAAGEVVAADAPNHRYGGSAVRAIGSLVWYELSRHDNVRVLTVPEADVDELSELYADGRRELLRETTPNFEPTSLVAVAALKQLRHVKGEVAVLGTGQNDTIYPTHASGHYQVPC